MKKILLGLLTVACSALQPALAQTPWVAPTTVPVYDSFNSGLVIYLHSPQPNVLWGLNRESRSDGPGKQAYQNRIYATADNGQTWQEAPKTGFTSYTNNSIPQVSTSNLTAVDAQNAWFLRSITFNGTTDFGLYRTTSGPTGFAKLAAVLPVQFNLVHFFTTTTGIAMGEVPASATTWPIYRTTDGGLTWVLVPNPPPAIVSTTTKITYDGRSMGNTLWLSATTGQLLRTSDMGLTWTAAPDARGGVFESELRGLRFYRTSPNLPAIYTVQRTSDGGLTWTDIPYTGTPGFTTLTAIAGRPGTYLSYDYRFPTASNLANGTTTVSYDWGASWQVLDTNIMSGVMEEFVSQYPGQLWAGVQGGTNLPSPPMVLRYSGPLLGAKKTTDPALALAAYPNPTTGLLHLQGPLLGPETVHVFDAAGRRCLSQTVSPAQPTVDLSRQPAGLYQLRVTSAAGGVRYLRVSKAQ